MQKLSQSEIDQFIQNGFVKLEDAFPKEVAAQAREILWRDTGCDPIDRTTWKFPVVRLGEYSQQPFVEAANTPRLHAAFDQLVGAGKWFPRMSLGSFPVRFPSSELPGDDGWHVDASFPGDDASSFLSWRVNVISKGRALLMLFLFSDVSELDAPTRIRVGSHRQVARILEPHDEDGLPFMELADKLGATADCSEVLATGAAGTVYLCHPFIAHAAQPHRGTEPRFLAQPPLIPKEKFQIERGDEAYSPVEVAIKSALNS
jgi:hypothetical protein